MPADSGTLRIVQVNTVDIGAGAAQVAWNLFQAYRARGQAAWLVVGHKVSDDPDVLALLPGAASDLPRSALWASSGGSPSSGGSEAEGAPAAAPRQAVRASADRWQRRLPWLKPLRYWLGSVAAGRPGIERALGVEDFNFPASRRLLDRLPARPDIVHAHNLHGGYFDLRTLPALSHQAPLVLSLHDAWLLSGHCAHSLACARWQTGCGHCPDLTLYPAVARDATAYNWRRKRQIYRRSRLFVATSSEWLMQKVTASMLAPGIVAGRVIPTGINLDLFRPAGKEAARAALVLPPDRPILLFMAQALRQNVWKDYATVRAAIGQVAARLAGPPPLLLAVGEEAPAEQIGGAEVRFVPWQRDPQQVARYYQAADVYVHGARVDTFPNTVLEALACGLPVVASAVGGIPEQIRHGETGWLVPPGDPGAMAAAIAGLLADGGQRQAMGRAAAEDAAHRFRLADEVDAYLAFYRAILAGEAAGGQA